MINKKIQRDSFVNHAAKLQLQTAKWLQEDKLTLKLIRF